MEFPEIAHDALLHKLDLPRREHLEKTLEAARHAAAISPLLQPHSGIRAVVVDETSPLLLATTRSDLAIAVADAILDAEEQKAVREDELLTAWEIISFEWCQLARLSAPMVRPRHAISLTMHPPDAAHAKSNTHERTLRESARWSRVCWTFCPTWCSV